MKGSVIFVALCVVFIGHIPSSYTDSTETPAPASSSSTKGTTDTTHVVQTTSSQCTTPSTVTFSESSIAATTEQHTTVSVNHPLNIGLYIGASCGGFVILVSLVIILVLYRQRRLCFKSIRDNHMRRNQLTSADVISPHTTPAHQNDTDQSVYGNKSRMEDQEAPEYYNECPQSLSRTHTYINGHIIVSFGTGHPDNGGPQDPYNVPDNVRYEEDGDHVYNVIKK